MGLRGSVLIAFSACVIGTAASAQSAKQPIQSIADAKGCKIWDQTIPPKSSITWSGSCKNGFMDSKGTLQWFREGKPTDRYDGELKDGYYDGRGTYVWANGNRYEGQFKKGLFDGKATYTSAKGDRFVGEYKNDRRIHGVMSFANGSRYEGDWSDGKAEGHGTYRGTGGHVYSGIWRNGCMRDGYGRVAIGVPLSTCP